MRSEPTWRCAIEQIADWHPELYLEGHIVAAVAVMSQYSPSPAEFEVDCEDIASAWLGAATRFLLEVSWSEETVSQAERLRRTIQAKPLVEMAAVSLACILTPHVVDLGSLDATDYGSRADYRSPRGPCLLEISGTENPSELPRRHQEKVAQALSNPFELDAYIVVCVFAPTGNRIRFSYHRYPQ